MVYTPQSGAFIGFFFEDDYKSPSGDNLELRLGDAFTNFDFSGAYTPPAGNAVNFAFGDVVAIDTVPVDLNLVFDLESVEVSAEVVLDCVPVDIESAILLDSGIVFEGAIPENFGLSIELEPVSVDQIYVARADDAGFELMVESVDVLIRPDYELPVSVCGGMGFRFRKAAEKSVETRILFENSTESNVRISSGWKDSEKAENELVIVWSEMNLFTASTESGWESAKIVEADIESGFRQMALFGNSLEVPLGNAGIKETDLDSSWLVPPEVNITLESGWFDKLELGKAVESSWLIPPEINVTHETRWGKKYYERICIRKYYPPHGDQVDFNIHHPIELTGDGNHADFFFDEYSYDERCTQREPSGWRENYSYKPPKNRVPRPPELGVYIVLNNAMLCRLPDRTPIEVLSMSLSSKIDSWCWDFKAVLGSASDLALVKPSDGTPVPVEVEINGWKWVMMIEDSEGSRQFPKGSWSVSGRSLSAELASPYAPIKTYTESNQRLARQLAEAELENTGWTFDWKIEDWLVPGNVFSVSNQTPMETILKIVRAAGGEIQSHRTEKILKAVSRYAKSPWSWAAETPVISLHESVIMTLGWSNERRPGYNGIYVSGSTAGGVTVFVKRNGTAGETQAGMIVDPLITAVETGRERGRVELCKAGNWSRQRLSLPLMAGTELPGLMNCGDLIEVQEGSVLWRGQVSDVTINATRQNGLKVYQNIEVERYHG